MIQKLIRFLLYALGLGILVCLLVEGIAHLFLPEAPALKSPAILMEADPDCGFRHKPSQTGYSIAGKVTINALGFRGPDWAPAKQNNKLRIALLGDSNIFGQGVSDDETLPYYLEKNLNNKFKTPAVEILNFGASGYDTGHEIKVLKKYGLPLHPDIVILSFAINDLYFIEDYGFYPEMFRREPLKYSTWNYRLRVLARHSRFLMWFWDYQKSFLKKNEVEQTLEDYGLNKLKPPHDGHEAGWAFFHKYLLEFKTLSEKENFIPILISAPSPQEMVLNANHPAYIKYLEEQARALGIPFFSVSKSFENFKSAEDPRLVPYDLHLSALGNQKAADELAGYLLPFVQEKLSQNQN